MLNRTFSLSALCAAAAMLPLAAAAADTAAGAVAPTAADTAAATGRLAVTETPQDTLVVVRDAETGKLRAATNEERDALQTLRANKRSMLTLRAVAATPQLKRHGTGATGVRLTDDMQSYSVMVRRADGTLEEQCFPTKQEADAAVAKGFTAKAELPTK